MDSPPPSTNSRKEIVFGQCKIWLNDDLEICKVSTGGEHCSESFRHVEVFCSMFMEEGVTILSLEIPFD